MTEVPEALIERLLAVLDREGIPAVVGGSLASSIHGAPRSTLDADIVVDLRPEHVKSLVAAVEVDYYADAAAIQQAVASGGSFNLIHYDTAFKVDIFVCGKDPFRHAQVRRGGEATVGASHLRVLSPEDIVLAKLQWYRMGGEVSERQWHDVQEVLTAQGTALDWEYLQRGAETLGVADLLAQALHEAED